MDSKRSVGAWAAANSLNTAKVSGAASGDSTAALVVGGSQILHLQTATEQFDGSSWTEVNDLNTGRNFIGGCGTNSSISIWWKRVLTIWK